MRSLSEEGRLVVTDHNETEAVILSTQEYDRLIKAARSAAANAINDPLQALRDRFDARLATLDMPDAGNRLRGVMRNPGVFGGKVKADR